MRLRVSLLLASTVALTSAQSSTDLLSVLASEAYSVFSSTTADQPTATIAASITSDIIVVTVSALSTFESFTSPPATQLTTFATFTSTPTSSTGLPASSQDASQTSSASGTIASGPSQPGDGNNDHQNNTVAIVLGTVFGVLGLGLLILAAAFVYRRRRQQSAATRAGYVAPSFDGRFETHRPVSSGMNPATTAAATTTIPYPTRSLGPGTQARIPLMSERSIPDLPIPYKAYSREPFIPGTQDVDAPRELSSIETGTIPPHDGRDFATYPAYGGSQNGLGDNREFGGNAGGIEVGSAISGRSTQRADYDEAWGSGDVGTYSSFLYGPTPPRTPHGTSFNGPDGSTDTLLRGASDTAGFVSTAHGDGSNRARSRRPSTPISHLDEEQMNTIFSTARQETAHAMSGFDRSGPHEMSAVLTPPAGRAPANPMDGYFMLPQNSAFTVSSGGEASNRSYPRPSSRTRTQPPLPPSLTIPKANPVRRSQSVNRSPKRARFAGNDTYHEPTQYSDSTSLRSSQISTPTTHASPWTPRSNQLSAGTSATDDVVSPISPDDSFARINHGMPITAARANLVHVPRNRDTSPNPPSQQTSHTSSPSTSRISRETSKSSGTSNRQSGLINAVQGHFNLRPVYTRQYSYDPFIALGSPHRTSFLNLDNTTIMARRNQKAITRKPVPPPSRQTARPARTTGTLESVKENWWKQSESGPSSSRLIADPPPTSKPKVNRLSADQWREQVDLAWHSDYDDEDDSDEGNIIGRGK